MEGGHINNLEQGVNAFNEGKYWEAHEAWEVVWKALQGDDKIYMQGLIQACGAFHHLMGQRIGPAKKLSKTAYEKIRDVKARKVLKHMIPRVEVPGLAEKLFDIFSTQKTRDFLDPAFVISLRKLKAVLVKDIV